MKKIIAANWVLAMAIVGVAFVLVMANADAQLISRTPSLRDLASQLKTPEAVAHYMWRNFAVEKDQRLFGVEDYWQTPETMLTTQKGDCEDFALFAYTMLKQNRVKAFILNVYGDAYGHSVCIFVENNRYNVIDGTQVVRLEATNLQDVATEIYPFWKNASVIIPLEGHKTPKVLQKITRG